MMTRSMWDMQKTAQRVGADRSPVAAIVLAGGTGSRFGADIPKQLVDLAGRPILYHALKAFDDPELADFIVVPANPAWFPDIRAVACEAVRRVDFSIVDGGATRNTSVAHALEAIPYSEAKVLIHDGVRPLVSSELIGRVTDALDEAECVLPTVPSIDPVVRVGKRRVNKFLARSRTMRGQSPQGFWLTRLREIFSDENVIVESRDTIFEVIRDYDPKAIIHHVAGDMNNVKVTMPVDRAIATAILAQTNTGLTHGSTPAVNPYK